jgi:nucleotide-binding universal stress UspA family protein
LSDADASSRPVLFAYDGSELAKHAIEEARRLLDPRSRPALVLTVWRPFDVGFVPVTQLPFDAEQIAEVRHAAEQTAAAGAELARAAGFEADSLAVEGAPAWKVIAATAEAQDACLIVFGSHGRTGIAGALVGSVAGSVTAHSHRSVLIVHRPS